MNERRKTRRRQEWRLPLRTREDRRRNFGRRHVDSPSNPELPWRTQPSTADFYRLLAFTDQLMVTFRNYYAQAISRSEVDAKIAEWLELRKELGLPW